MIKIGKEKSKQLNKGFCEGCRLIKKCGKDDISYPCHGEFAEIDADRYLPEGTHSAGLWYLDPQ